MKLNRLWFPAFLILNILVFSLQNSIASESIYSSPEHAGKSKKLQKNHYEIKKISFSSGKLKLFGIIYKPLGAGPFPTILFNHGSSLETKAANAKLGPLFASHGWVFFMPSRRGQGLSRHVGAYIGDEIEQAQKKGGDSFAVETMVQLLKGTHLDDQRAALAWLRKQPFVAANKIAVAGVSFGGIETILGMEQEQYCAGIDIAGAAQSWSKAPQLQKLLTHSVKKAKGPIFFFQAKNDYNLAPTYRLSQAMKRGGKKFQVKIYPSFGNTKQEGHSFGYFGGPLWSKDVFAFLYKYCN